MSPTRSTVLGLCLGFWLLGLLMPVSAAPWVRPGDERMRDDIQRLADAGVLGLPVGTWPVPWRDLLTVLGDPRTQAIDRPDLEATIARLQRRAVQETSVGRTRWTWGMAGGDLGGINLRGFQERPRENGEGLLSLEANGDRIAGRVALTGVAFDASQQDSEDLQIDGSHLTGYWGNWLISAGALDQWWGPGHRSSLILSTNARPVPGVYLMRNSAQPFGIPGLSWLGHWRLVLFGGQTRDDRAVDKARLLGGRLELRPVSFLTLGVSRTAQWGGDDRPEDPASIGDLIVSNDNVGADEHPGNQLGGFDVRLRAPVQWLPLAVYGQIIGEEEAGKLPAWQTGLFGAEAWGRLGALGQNWRGYVEYVDTTARFHRDETEPNVTYEHFIYESGYRHYGRSIGHSLDNDSQLWTLGVNLVHDNGGLWGLRLLSGELNTDGTDDTAPGGNPLVDAATDLRGIGLLHERAALFGTRIGLGVEGLQLEPVGGGDTSLETTAYFEIRRTW